MPNSESEPKWPKKDLKKEWDKAMKNPISTLGACFGSLKLNTWPVAVSKPCSPKVAEALHKLLQKIDPKYDPSIREASHLREKTDIFQYIQLHVTQTPYSLSIQKCGKDSCCICAPFYSNKGKQRDLVLQQQPTPRLNKVFIPEKKP
eukprot:431324-Ditylum_brightwellii.AAC.1